MLRPWKLKVDIRRDAGVAIYLQIAQRVIEEIQRGRLVPGMALPGTRELAEDLGINRKTVVLAYDELVAQGWLSAEGKRGTFVSSAIPALDEVFSASTPPAARDDRAPHYMLYGTEMPADVPQARDMLIVAQDQHWQVLDAIERREGARAEAIMREHSRIAQRNLREAVQSHNLDQMPGVRLIRKRS